MKEEPERGYKREVTDFCSIILEVTFHHFCHKLFIGNKLLGPAHTQGGEITQGHKCQKVGSLDAISEAAYHKQQIGLHKN